MRARAEVPRRPARKCIHVYIYTYIACINTAKWNILCSQKQYIVVPCRIQKAKSGLKLKESAVATLVRIKEEAGLAKAR